MKKENRTEAVYCLGSCCIVCANSLLHLERAVCISILATELHGSSCIEVFLFAEDELWRAF